MVQVGGMSIASGCISFPEGRVAPTELQMHEVKQAVDLYAIKHEMVPSTSEGLKVVYHGLSMDVPKDAWDHEFVYVTPGPDGHKYDVISYGSDGVEGGTGNAADIRLSDLR
jgi:general secretion pathway protein G